MQGTTYTKKELRQLPQGTLVLAKLDGDDEDFFPAQVLLTTGQSIILVRTLTGELEITLPVDPSLLKRLNKGDVSESARRKLAAKVQLVAEAKTKIKKASPSAAREGDPVDAPSKRQRTGEAGSNVTAPTGNGVPAAVSDSSPDAAVEIDGVVSPLMDHHAQDPLPPKPVLARDAVISHQQSVSDVEVATENGGNGVGENGHTRSIEVAGGGALEDIADAVSLPTTQSDTAETATEVDNSPTRTLDGTEESAGYDMDVCFNNEWAEDSPCIGASSVLANAESGRRCDPSSTAQIINSSETATPSDRNETVTEVGTSHPRTGSLGAEPERMITVDASDDSGKIVESGGGDGSPVDGITRSTISENSGAIDTVDVASSNPTGAVNNRPCDPYRTTSSETAVPPSKSETVTEIDTSLPRTGAIEEEAERLVTIAHGVDTVSNAGSKCVDNGNEEAAGMPDIGDLIESSLSGQPAEWDDSTTAFDRESRCFATLADSFPAIAPFVSPRVADVLQLAQMALQDVSDMDSFTVPEEVTCTLPDYQIEGCAWLMKQYDSGVNCILGDDLSLGTNEQISTFLAHLVHVRKQSGYHLIISPLHDLFHWENVLRAVCPSLNVLRMYTQNADILAQFESVICNQRAGEIEMGGLKAMPNIILTTFSMLSGTGGPLLTKVYWKSVVLDGWKRIVKPDGALARTCTKLSAHFRVVLRPYELVVTGDAEPCLLGYYSLLRFLHPDIFMDPQPFVSALQTSTDRSSAVKHVEDKLIHMLQPFLLRRREKDIEHSDIPQAQVVYVRCPRSDLQRELADEVLAKNRNFIEKYSQRIHSSTDAVTDNVGSDDSALGGKKLKKIVIELQNISNHPYLCNIHAECSQDGSLTDDVLTVSGKMNLLDQLLKKLNVDGHRVLIVSQSIPMLDLLEDYLWWRKYSFIRVDVESTAVAQRVLIDRFNDTGSNYFVCLQSYSIGLRDVNLSAVDAAILYDSDWDAQVDLQAIKRCHRLRQCNPVRVYRLVSGGSAEEAMTQAAANKLLVRYSGSQGDIDDVGLSRKKRKRCASKATLSAEDDLSDNDSSSIGVRPADVSLARTLYAAVKHEWNKLYCTAGVAASWVLSDKATQEIVDGRAYIDLSEFQHEKSSYISKTISGISVSCAAVSFLNAEPLSEFRGMLPAPPSGPVTVPTIEAPADQSKNRKSNPVIGSTVAPAVSTSGIVRMLIGKARAKNKKKYINQDFCQLCWDGGELLLCDHCPASYHPHLACITNITCLPVESSYRHLRWKCPLHKCGICQLPAENAALIFTCEICPAAYCEGCLIQDAKIIGASSRFEKLGHKLQRGYVYIHCSVDCANFALNEAENNIREIEEINKNIGAIIVEKPFSAKHLKGDIEKDTARISGVVPVADSAVAALPGQDCSPSSTGIPAARLAVLLERSLSANLASVRFRSLSEICGLRTRWRSLTAVRKSQMNKLVRSVHCFLDALRAKKSSKGELVLCCENESLETLGSVPEDSATMEGNVLDFSATLISSEYATVECCVGLLDLLKTVMLPWSTADLVEISILLGIGMITSASSSSARRGPVQEPKFRYIAGDSVASKQFLMDSIALFLVTMQPQNMIYVEHCRNQHDGQTAEVFIDVCAQFKSSFYVLRWLEAQVHRYTHLDGVHFVANSSHSLLMRIPPRTLVTDMTVLVGLAPGFRLHDALQKSNVAPFLPVDLKHVFTTYTYFMKFLTLKIPDKRFNLDSMDPQEISWESLRRKSLSLLECGCTSWGYGVERAQPTEIKLFEKCKGERPDKYCRVVVSLLHLLKTRRFGEVNSTTTPETDLSAQNNGTVGGVSAFGGDPRTAVPAKAVPTQGEKSAGLHQDIIRLDQDDDSTTANSLPSVRQKFYNSMHQFLSSRHIPDVANLTKIVESIAFSKSESCVQTYMDFCEVLIGFVREVLSRNVPIGPALQEFMLRAPEKTSSWREYGTSVVGAMLHPEAAISPVVDSVADDHLLSWLPVRKDIRSLIARVLRIYSVTGDEYEANALCLLMESLLFAKSASSIPRYRQLARQLCSRVAGALQTRTSLLDAVINSFVGECDRQLSLTPELEQTKIEYARSICLRTLTDMFDACKTPKILRLELKFRLWGNFSSYDEFLRAFQSLMSALLENSNAAVEVQALYSDVLQHIDCDEDMESAGQEELQDESMVPGPPNTAELTDAAKLPTGTAGSSSISDNTNLIDVPGTERSTTNSVASSAMLLDYTVYQKYSILVGLHLFGADTEDIARFAELSVEAVQLLLSALLSKEQIEEIISSETPPDWVFPEMEKDSAESISTGTVANRGDALWADLVCPIVKACLCLERTLVVKARMSEERHQVLITFFASAKALCLDKKMGVTKPDPSLANHYKESIEFIASWYKIFYRKFLQSFNDFVNKCDLHVKKLRVLNYVVNQSLVENTTVESVFQDRELTSTEVSKHLDKLKLLIKLRITTYLPELLRFDNERDADLVFLAVDWV